MPIEITLPPLLQPLAGDLNYVKVTGGTVGECLDNLVNKYPGIKPKLFNRNGKLLNGISIFLNRENIIKDPIEKTVKEGDKIHISFVVLGG